MMANGLKIINDPIHGFVKIPYKIILEIIEHSYFQRLRRISQTGLLNLVYPGAMHTRFHHAIGAMHLMYSALETLKSKGVEISEEEEKSAMIAILLHDIGHGPFSHALESLLMENWHHEKLSILLMNKLNEEFSGELSMALEMFQGKYHRKFFYQLISSQLDVDRLDYLRRDSFYTGVAEGNVNTQRIISMMNVCDDELLIDEKGIYSIEQYLTARMFMYWQVYFHKVAVISERLLVKILKRAKYLIGKGHQLEASENLKYFLYKNDFQEATEEDVRRFTELDDTDVLQAIKSWEKSDDFVLAYLCKTIVRRKMPKILSSSNAFSEQEIQEKIAQTNQRFGITEGEWLVEQVERSLLPYDGVRQPIFLLQKDGNKIELQKAQHQILSVNINKENNRYVLSFPKNL